MKLMGNISKESRTLSGALSPRAGGGRVKDVTYDGTSLVNEQGVAVIPEYPSVPVKGVTYNGSSIVNEQGVAVIPPYPSVKTLYTIKYYADNQLLFTEYVANGENCQYKYGTNQWCLVNGGSVVQNITENVTSDLTLYAKYKIIDIWDGVPFPTFSKSNGCVLQGTLIDNGYGSVLIKESQAGYEGFNFKLNNLTIGKTYKCSFDLRFYDCQYFVNQYMCGYLIETNQNTEYQDYSHWQNNLIRDNVERNYTNTFTALASVEYLTFNVCGLSDERTNYFYLKNIVVYEEV